MTSTPRERCKHGGLQMHCTEFHEVEKTPCCDLCLIYNSQDKDMEHPECMNPQCECHKGAPKEPCTHTQLPSGAMYCLRPDGCTYRVEKNDAPEWKEKLNKLLWVHMDIEAGEGTRPMNVALQPNLESFIEAQKALSYEEGKKSRDEEVAMKIQDGFKAGIAKAIEEVRKMKYIDLSDLLTTLEKLDL